MKTVLFLVAIAAALVCPPWAEAGPVSGTSLDPFAGCASDFPDLQPGTLYPNSEVEPSLAVNPRDERNLVAAWQQDRWSNAGSRGIVVATSFDGGVTWTTVTQTKTSLCTGGTAFRASNPWLAFGADGTAYLVNGGIPFFGQSAVAVSRSLDGGRTWSGTVLTTEASNAMNDKPTITADPVDADAVYAVWTRNEFPNERAAPPAEEHSSSSRGPAWFSRTLDGGRTWESAREIFDPGAHNGTLGHQIAVLPGSGLVDVFELEYGRADAHGLRGVHVAAVRSSDRGARWSQPTLIADALPVPVVDPLTGARIRTGMFIPDVAVDPASGTLFAVWLDARFSGGDHDDIALALSTDGGLTWTRPMKANRTPMVLPPGNRQAFTPAVHVAADGAVGVSYYDLRHNGSDGDAGDPLDTDRFLARCDRLSASEADRCAGSWSEARLTPASFDLRAAPNSEGLFLGGYQGLASAGGRFVSLSAQASGTDDPATVYFAAGP
jgi:hypothetical protein